MIVKSIFLSLFIFSYSVSASASIWNLKPGVYLEEKDSECGLELKMAQALNKIVIASTTNPLTKKYCNQAIYKEYDCNQTMCKRKNKKNSPYEILYAIDGKSFARETLYSTIEKSATAHTYVASQPVDPTVFDMEFSYGWRVTPAWSKNPECILKDQRKVLCKDVSEQDMADMLGSVSDFEKKSEKEVLQLCLKYNKNCKISKPAVGEKVWGKFVKIYAELTGYYAEAQATAY